MNDSLRSAVQQTTRLTDDLVLPFRMVSASVSGRLVRLGMSVDQIIAGHDYPESVSRTLSEAWQHFAVISNEVVTPKVFKCASDNARDKANDWSTSASDGFSGMKNNALSYFVGTDSNDSLSQMHVLGDRNIVGQDNETCATAGVTQSVVTKLPPGSGDWKNEIHGQAGNLCMGDGSVQQLSVNGLRAHLLQTGDANSCALKP